MKRPFVLIPLLMASILSARSAGDEFRCTVPTAPAETVIAEAFGAEDLESLRRRGESYWPSVLAVFVDGSDAVPPMLGTYRLDAGRLIFTPRFPFQPGPRRLRSTSTSRSIQPSGAA